MKFPATAPSFSAGDRASFCPECSDLMVAAARSQHLGENLVRHWWCCESCGHEFRTTVQLPALGADSKRVAAA